MKRWWYIMALIILLSCNGKQESASLTFETLDTDFS